MSDNIKNAETADAFSQMKKNNVSSKGQLKESQYVSFENLGLGGKRIMFAGNSITLHGVLESIGWNNRWGMAASSKEKDYVHLMMKKISERIPDAEYCICQVSSWEGEYKNGSTLHHLFENARNFDADIIIMRFVENCPGQDIDAEKFKKELHLLLEYFNPNGKAKFVISTGFWHHPLDFAIEEYAKENNLPLVLLGDLGEQDEMKDIGLFWHDGVANHPGDLGMEKIAERLFEETKKFL